MKKTPDVKCAKLTRMRICTVCFVVTASACLLLLHCATSRNHSGSGCFQKDTKSVKNQHESVKFAPHISPNVSDEDYVDYFQADAESVLTTERLRHNGLEQDANLHQHLLHVIIIGVRKGGTRALLEFLNLHSQIAAVKAEMHFFDDDENYSLGLDWYRSRMPYARDDQLTMEKTPAYFSVDTVPRRIHRMNRTCKFLLIVRDPTERAISDYTQIYFNRLAKKKSFASFENLALDKHGFLL